jgi:hypothetical protein
MELAYISQRKDYGLADGSSTPSRCSDMWYQSGGVPNLLGGDAMARTSSGVRHAIHGTAMLSYISESIDVVRFITVYEPTRPKKE